MKKLLTKTLSIFAIALMVASNCLSQTSSTGNNEVSEESECKLIQNIPNPFSEVSLIGFSIAENGYVRIAIIDDKDNTVEILADGRVGKGDHYIYFKPADSLKTGDLRCRMQVMSDLQKIVYSEDIVISYVK